MTENLNRVCGALSAAASAYFLIPAFRMETAVRTPDAPAGFEAVANLQLMHIQTINFELGIGAAIVAAIFLAAASICGILERRTANDD